jgi:hypothetical protein
VVSFLEVFRQFCIHLMSPLRVTCSVRLNLNVTSTLTILLEENKLRISSVAPCSLVEIDRRFRGSYCLHHQGDDLAAREKAVEDLGEGRTVSTSETSANFYQTTWFNIPEDSHLHTRRRENLNSHSSLCNFPHSLRTLSVLGSNILIVTFISCALNRRSFRRVRGEVCHTYSRVGKISVLYRLIESLSF